MAKVYRIGGRDFQTKEAVTNYVSAVLNAAPVGTEVTGQDTLVFFDLLALREDKLAEIGERKVVGFDRAYREGKENWTRCFWVLLDDGTKMDMSVYKAIRMLDPVSG